MVGNACLAVELCPERGNLSALHTRHGTRRIPWASRPGSVAIVDELRRRTYREVDHPATIDIRRTRRCVESRRRFKGADFVVTESWRAAKDSLHWGLEIVLDAGAKPRSIQVRQLLPYPDPAYGLAVWTARADFPTTVERLGGLNLRYGELCHGTLLPSLTLYREDLETGLTVTKPLGFRTARLSFEFMDYRSEGVELCTSMLAPRPDQPARTRFVLHAHPPCWRSGLAWLYREYPKYFDPPNPRVREVEGGYVLAHPHMTDAEYDSMLPHDLRWEELHCHFPRYGDYLPDEPAWRPIDTWDACVAADQAGGAVVGGVPEDDSSIPPDERPLANNVIKNHIRRAQRHGVKSLYYWQCAGDASPSVVEKFPDSVARDRNGDPYPSVPGSILLNADPGTTFGQDMLARIRRLFRRLPEIDGIFLDQLCYDAVDHAHDDGITMSGNRPAYSLWHCYQEPVRRLAAAVHRRGKIVYANGPHNIEVQRDMDGLMAEGLSWLADVVKYLCIAKPLLFLSFYHHDPGKAESMLQRCLLCGASYSLFPHPPRPVRNLIEAYRPLVEKLYGRRWLLEPDPLDLPGGVDGNIFVGENGNPLISIVSTRESALHDKSRPGELEVVTRFSGVSRVQRAVSLGPRYRGERPVRLRREDGQLRLVIPAHTGATVIELKG